MSEPPMAIIEDDVLRELMKQALYYFEHCRPDCMTDDEEFEAPLRAAALRFGLQHSKKPRSSDWDEYVRRWIVDIEGPK